MQSTQYKCLVCLQAAEWLDDSVQQKEGSLQKGWLLLEEAQRRQDDARRPHETQSARRRVYLRLLRALCHHADLPQEVLLAPAGEILGLAANPFFFEPVLNEFCGLNDCVCWQNPDVVLVHYLNVLPMQTDDNKVSLPSLTCTDKKDWTREELISQLRPMCNCKCKLFQIPDSACSLFSLQALGHERALDGSDGLRDHYWGRGCFGCSFLQPRFVWYESALLRFSCEHGPFLRLVHRR